MIVLGLAVAVVAVLALHSPSRHTAGTVAASATAGSHTSSTRSPSTSPSSRTSASASTSSTSSSPAPGSSPSTGASTGDSAHSVPLVVLNNTTTSGLAAQAAKRFRAGGWTVTSYGNLTNDIASTCAYYDPSVAGAQAAALALQHQYPTIKRVVPKFAELPAGPVVVVLTPDYSPG